MNDEARKAQLLNFIKYKIQYEDDKEEVLEKCRKMSYHKLREWAIRNDIID